MSGQRVVVTGLGVISPNGIGRDAFWSNTVQGVSGVKPYRWGQAYGFKSVAMGQVTDFSHKAFGLDEEVVKGHGRYLQFALAATKMAVEDAELQPESLDPLRVGVSVASAIADAAKMESNLLTMTRNCSGEADRELVEETFLENMDFGVAAFEIAKIVGAAGAVFNLSTGCTAGVDALGFAFEQIRTGKADVMLAGASEAPLCPLSVGSFEALGALSTRLTRKAQEASCPYSLERDGFVIAEGCGMFVLESYDHAVARGARIYAEITGYASVNNAHHMTDLTRDGKELARCIRLALDDASCPPAEVDHVSAHGSSTKQNDENETGALKEAFGEAAARRVPINSLKSMTGHALAAANAIEMVALCLEIEKRTLHPTINHHTPDPACDLHVLVEPHRGPVRSVVKLSSGFSGIHSVLVMKAA